jgi:hypothetical protein
MKNLRRWLFALTGGILFAAFDRCGYLLKNYGSIWAVSENPWHRTIFHRILLRMPVSILAVFALLYLVDVLKNRACTQVPGGRWQKLSDWKYWFAGMWLLYFVSFLPAFLGGFPGIFAADAPNQVGWTFSGWLTAHHPLLHTGILCGIFKIVRSLGGSDNTAAAIYTILQMAALSGIFAWISRFLKKEKAPVWLQIGTVLFLCLMPFHGLMAVYTTKDTIFSGIFVLALMQIYRMCTEPEVYFAGYGKLLGGFCCFVLLFLFRNNGFHTLLLCVPFLLIALRKYWKKLVLLFIGLLAVYQIYNGPLLSLIGAEPGNAREMYSVVIQTLARTYVAGGEILPEEMDVIRPVLDEEALSLYTPNLSDPVKNLFHTDAFNEEKGEFLKTWMQIGLRNKKIYIDAFLNTTVGFWYPNVDGEYLDFVCFDIEKDDPNYPHVQMTPLSQTFYQYYSAIGTDAVFRNIPIIRELFSMGFYLWAVVFAALYMLYAKSYGKLLWIIPYGTYLGTSLLGPAALLRYGYPVMLGAPVLLFFLLKEPQK